MRVRFLLLFLSFPFLLFSNDFYSIDEFTLLHPNEKTKMKKFNTLVKNAPKELKIKQDKPTNITIIYPAGQFSDYWRRSRVAFEKRLKLLKIDYKIKSFFIDASNIQEQNKRIKETFISDSDYLIFTLSVKEHKKIISQILSRKKPKVIMQNITTPLREWKENQPFFYVGFDHMEGTKLLADYYKKRFKDKAKYGLLYYKNGYISHMRADSFITMMPKSFQLLDSFYTDGRASKAYEATKVLLKKHSDIDFVYASSTDVCIGATKAFEELDKYPAINGWGGGAFEIELLKQKKIDVTVMRINDDNGIAMAEAIKLDLEQKDKQIPQIYSGNFILLDQNTPEKMIFKYSKEAFRYSGLK